MTNSLFPTTTSHLSPPHFLDPNPNHRLPLVNSSPSFPLRRRNFKPTPTSLSRTSSNSPPPSPLLHLAAPAILFFVGLRAASACSVPPPGLTPPPSTSTKDSKGLEEGEGLEVWDEEAKREFEAWKEKKFALTVPLRIVGLHGSFPASWVKDFMQSQSRRVRVNPEFRGSIQTIFSELNLASKKGYLDPKSVMAADVVSMGDSWLTYAIGAGLVEPLRGAEDHKWFNDLNNRWRMLLRRKDDGSPDPNGNVWGVPYRWGSMVIAYRKDKFTRKNFAPIEDWGDLWRPELAGRISMVDSPREVVGAVLKYMGASYNTKNIDAEVLGGKSAVTKKLTLLQRQVRLFDSVHYLKAFTSGDVWVAVGWSSDVLATAKRMSNVEVVVPKSGSSLWADLWAVPAATKFPSSEIGGRIRGPSPLIYQWIEFCLQPARAFPFKQEVIPGSSPLALGPTLSSIDQEIDVGTAKVNPNLVFKEPLPETLARCEFLEPLSGEALMDYKWLISRMQKPSHYWFSIILHHLSLVFQRFQFKSFWR